MKRREDLFDLVKSLSRSEKRYFRMNTAIQQGDKQYLSLFDALQKQEKYDEAAIIKMLGGNVSANRFNFQKNYLYKAILNTLQQLHSKSDYGTLKGFLQKIRILYDKGLYSQSVKMLKRAKKMAEDFEDYLTMIEVLKHEKRLLEKEKVLADFQTRSKQLWQEGVQYQRRLNQLVESDFIFSEVRFLYNKYGNPRSDKELEHYRNIFENPLFRLLEEGTNLPHKAKEKLLLSKIVFYICRYDHQQHFHYAQQLLALYQKDKSKILQNPNNYLTALSYYLKSCAFLGKKEEFDIALSEVKMLNEVLPASKKNNSLSANIFYTSYYNELFFHLQNCYIDKCLDLIENVKEGLQKYEEQFTNTERLYLTYSMALVYFGLGRFSESLSWFNHILNTFKQDTAPYIYLRIRLMLLINHYEIGNLRLLDYLVVATYRYLLKKRKLYQYETAVIRFIRKLPNVDEKQKLDALFNQLLLELHEIIKDPLEYAGCAWFVFWLEGKEAGLSLPKVFEIKALEKSSNVV